MRASPLGCNVSTITFLSVLGAIFGVLVFIFVGLMVVRVVHWMRRRWKEVRYEDLGGQEGSSGIVSRLTSMLGLDGRGTQIRTRGQEDGQGIEESAPLLG